MVVDEEAVFIRNRSEVEVSELAARAAVHEVGGAAQGGNQGQAAHTRLNKLRVVQRERLSDDASH